MNEFKNATFNQRLGAFMIDFLIACIIQGLLFIPFIIIPLIQKDISATDVTVRNLWLTLFTFTYLIFRDIPNGRSIGKKTLGLQALSLDGYPASIASLIIRNLFVVLYPVEAILLYSSSGRKRLGDIVARTGVFEYNIKEKA